MAQSRALFGSSSNRNQSKNLVEFRAGKMTLKGKMVHPDTRKGLLYVHQSEDSLMHLCWKDRAKGTVEDVSVQLSLTMTCNSTFLAYSATDLRRHQKLNSDNVS